MVNEIALSSSIEHEAIALIEGSRKLSDSTKDKYTRILRKYLATGESLTDARALREFADGLKGSQRSFLKAAVSKWADYVKGLVQAQASPESLAAVDATIHQLEALKGVIELDEQKGSKVHTWLSREQVVKLKGLMDRGDVVGARDCAVIGLMVSAGLRRAEVCSLKFDDIELLPNGKGERAVIHVREGKGAKVRSIPISDALYWDLRNWGGSVGNRGFVARALGRNKEPGAEAMSSVAVFQLVRRYGELLGVPQLAPHDLRRSFAKLSYAEGKGVELTQLSMLLGHESLDTTKRYLGVKLDLSFSASDMIPW